MTVEQSWSSKELAHSLCNALVAKGQLKEKPAFIRTDREAKIAGIFETISLDGEKMCSFENVGPLEMMLRRGTSGEPWLVQVQEALIAMLPEGVRSAAKTMKMDSATLEEFEAAKERTEKNRARRDSSQRETDGGYDNRGSQGKDRDRDFGGGYGDREDRGWRGTFGDRNDREYGDRGGDRFGDRGGKGRGEDGDARFGDLGGRGKGEKGRDNRDRGFGDRGGKGNRRDERNEIDQLLAEAFGGGDSPVQISDFDFRSRKFLTETKLRKGMEGFEEAVEHVNKYSVDKGRDSVRNWKAYIYTLLKKLDPDLEEELSSQDRANRAAKGAGRGGDRHDD
eukprot:TRINITY_DN48902_c0_g1_i1.p1 TRINITY_DN48902_c0_g1~~TRINITY_DN48902_c0_g1_i1.p1  ORF type:complete len:353 (+),score=75.01 TRINITY_DN48902_c0_g1_i1:51-1061(+)